MEKGVLKKQELNDLHRMLIDVSFVRVFVCMCFYFSFVGDLYCLDGLKYDCSNVALTDNAGTNKAASSSTSLNTKRLDEDTENLAREYYNIYRQRIRLCLIYLLKTAFSFQNLTKQSCLDNWWRVV